MDSIFLLDEAARSQFIQTLAQTLGSTYICLWSYYPFSSNDLSSHLHSIDGWYNEETQQPSSSSGSLGRRLFDMYRRTLCSVENGYVPGLACKEGIPYLELQESELVCRASAEAQRQFYQEARIKIAAFLGCKLGEIEIGMLNPNQVNMEMEIKSLFPDDFSLQHSLQVKELPPPPDHHQSWPSSSSSSLRSLSVGSPEYSSLLFSMPSSSNYIMEAQSAIGQAIRPTSTTLPLHQQMILQPAAYPSLSGIRFLNPESDDAAMTRAMLAVISSPSSSSSSHRPQVAQERSGAFNRYNTDISSSSARNVQGNLGINPHGQNAMKRVFALLRSMNLRRIQEQSLVSGRPPPTSSRLHHKISERKRREKLNESFQELRSLLPPGSKRDKASVLSNARNYLNALKTEIIELKQKNQQLEARVSGTTAREAIRTTEEAGGSSNRGIDVHIRQASELPSEEEREAELRISVRGDCNVIDLAIRILEFLKQVQNVNLVSMEVDSELMQEGSVSIYRLNLRLKIEGMQWDESSFKEAIRRVISDLVHR